MKICTRTVSRKICIQPGRYTSQPFCMLREDLASREKTLCDSRRDFAEKKSSLNDAFRALLLYKVIPRTLFLGIRRSASTLERSKHRADSICRFVFFVFRARGSRNAKEHENRVTKDDVQRNCTERRFYCFFRSECNYIVTI